VEFRVSGFSRGHLEVRVLDVQGRVRRFFSIEATPEGNLPLRWDGWDGEGRAVGPGVYLTEIHG
jgi:hypothetical protein